MTEDDLKALFPALEDDPGFRISSDFCPGYNCVAYAAGDSSQLWEPIGSTALTPAGTYWPPGVVALPTLTAYAAAFETLGYSPCGDGALETGWEKIVIFTLADGTPAHAARQLETGVWTSKIGGAEDIEHTAPEAVACPMYGAPALFMRRPLD